MDLMRGRLQTLCRLEHFKSDGPLFAVLHALCFDIDKDMLDDDAPTLHSVSLPACESVGHAFQF